MDEWLEDGTRFGILRVTSDKIESLYRLQERTSMSFDWTPLGNIEEEDFEFLESCESFGAMGGKRR